MTKKQVTTKADRLYYVFQLIIVGICLVVTMMTLLYKVEPTIKYFITGFVVFYFIKDLYKH